LPDPKNFTKKDCFGKSSHGANAEDIAMAIVFERVDGRLVTVPQILAQVVAQTDEIVKKPKHHVKVAPEHAPMGTRYGNRGAEKKRMLQLA